MAEEETETTEEETPAAEETPVTGEATGTPGGEAEDVSADAAEEAPEAVTGEATDTPGGEAEDVPADPDSDLPWKERRRLRRSRQSAEAKPQRSGEERSEERSAERKRLAAARGRRRAAERAAATEKGTGTPPAEHDPNAAKVRQGIVISDKADKTITVRIDIARRHPTYEKVVRRSRTLHAHDERNEAGAGDTVRIVETRPLSKLKRWRLVEVVEKAK